MILSSLEDVYQVPNDAVGEEDGQSVIYVQQDDGTFSATPVTVSTASDYYSIIEGDLSDGMVIRASANESEAEVNDSQSNISTDGNMFGGFTDAGGQGGGGDMGGGMQGGPGGF